MKNLSYFTLLISILGFILLGCERQSNNPVEIPPSAQSETINLSKSGDAGPSTNGQALIEFPPGSGEKQTFAFEAREFEGGTVKGSFQIKVHAAGVRLYGLIDCLTISENVATMSGEVTQSNFPFVPLGDDVWFRVMDNGEGENGPDEWSDLWLDVFTNGPFPDCNASPKQFKELIPIEAGNIQVKP